MSLQPEPVPPVPEETARVARAAFPKGHPYLTMRDTFGAFFQDHQFAALFSRRGQPAHAPWRLALVTLLQFAENLSDRQAAEAVRRCIDWKYLLGLELTDPGFDPSVLCEFRARLLEGSAEQLLFETLLEQFREHQLLKARGKQRTDSTHVLAAIRNLNRLEVVGETLRHALNALAVVMPEWLRAHSHPEWADRYGRRVEEERFPKGETEREARAKTLGADGFALLAALYAPSAPAWLREIPAVGILRAVWVQQYYRDAAGLRFRRADELPPAAQLIHSPYDAEARYSKKRSTGWVGYKVHLTETCEPDTPLLITDVQTTPAPVPDGEVTPAVHAALQAKDRLPGKHLVDPAYVDAGLLVKSRERYDVDLVGPLLPDTGWQARQGAGFGAGEFRVNWAGQYALCPQGKRSRTWQPTRDGGGHPVIRIGFAAPECADCPSRERCTRGKSRSLTVRAEKEYQALQAGRQRQSGAEFAREYAARAGVEGTLSQGVRVCELRRCRYVGEAKTHLQHLLTAAALNFLRVAQWLRETPRAKTRRSAFLRVLAAT
jgi:transposase